MYETTVHALEILGHNQDPLGPHDSRSLLVILACTPEPITSFALPSTAN
jgi:hypothetical protein